MGAPGGIGFAGARRMLSSLLSVFSQDLAIDLGTAHTCVYARGRGIVVNEPSIVAVNSITGRIEAVGAEAKDMVGRTPRNITAIRPRVIIGVPSETTQVERRAVRDTAIRAKASEVHLIEESMAAAIGAGMPITEAAGNIVVDIGGGTTDIAVISLAGVVYSRSVRIAGNELDEAIILHAKKVHNLLIGERTAEQIKIHIGSAAELETPLTMEVKGRHLSEGRPKTIVMNDTEIRKALADPVRAIVQAVHDALDRIPPELSADIFDRGIMLTGGGSLLTHLDRRLRDDTGLPVQMAEEPLTSVALGAGTMLSDFPLLRRICID